MGRDTDPLLVERIDGKNVLIRGLWHLHHTEGLPMSIALAEFLRKDIHPNVYTTTDEMIKGEADRKTILRIIKEAFKQDVSDFLDCSYEQQRKIINHSLFGDKSEEWLRDNMRRLIDNI